jgi:hypothetical protein
MPDQSGTSCKIRKLEGKSLDKRAKAGKLLRQGRNFANPRGKSAQGFMNLYQRKVGRPERVIRYEGFKFA